MLLQLSKILILSLMIFLVKGQDSSSSSSTVSSSSSQFSSYSSSEFFPPSSESLNGQYIFSFTSDLYVMAIDINDGSLVVNQSLNQPILPSRILSYDPTTYIFNYFGSYMDPLGTQYLMANYTLEYNQITGVSRSIIDSLYYSDAIQPYVQIGNNFYMPIVDIQNPSTNLNIRNWNVKTFTVGNLEIELPDFNSSLNSLDAYDSEKDLYYVFYYGNGDEVERIPYVSTFTGSSLSFYEDSSSSNSGSNSNGGSISSFITTKFPNSGKSSLVYNNGVVSIFVKSSTLYAIEQLPTSINILKLNLEDSSVKTVYSSVIDRFTYDFISYFLTDNNNYLVTLNLDQFDNVLYSFIDLNTFVLAHSFSSPNYFNNNAEDFDTFFYFNGLI
ncbi:hypothetical protein ACTFIU_009547 [Dictyostelium citrinum]